MVGYGFRFPHLGIDIKEFGCAVDIFGVKISYYVIFMTVAIIAGFAFTMYEVHRTWQQADVYLNAGICSVLVGVVMGRVVDVIINWQEYNSFIQILNFRRGGISTAGGMMAALVVCIIFSYYKKIPCMRMIDTASTGVIIGQMILCIGKFMSRIGYGSYTDWLFAIQIRLDDVHGVMTQEIQDKIAIMDGVKYIQVHPVFLYEFCADMILAILLLVFRRKKKYDSEIFLWYLAGYSVIKGVTEIFAIGRVELLYKISVLQMLSGLLFIIAITILIVKRIKIYKSEKDNAG